MIVKLKMLKDIGAKVKTPKIPKDFRCSYCEMWPLGTSAVCSISDKVSSNSLILRLRWDPRCGKKLLTSVFRP